MSEFTYDLKLFIIEDVNSYGNEMLSFSLEIFALNEPDYIYRYNYPVNHQSNDITKSMSFT